MSSSRIRFNRSLFTAPLNGEPPEEFVGQLAAEDIELVVDVRSREEQTGRPLDALCHQAEIYYVTAQDVVTDGNVGRAASFALRHRTCIIGDPDDTARLALSQQIAGGVGMRVIDMEANPASISRTRRPQS